MEEGLPHAGISTVLGLLEILDDCGGSRDIFRLAGELNFDLEDLMPVLKAAELLSFVEMKKGDVSITEKGKRLVESDVHDRKQMVKESLLHIPVFKEFYEILRHKKDKHMDESFFIELLEQHFSPEEARKQFQTIIDWGRYAELVGYNADTGELFID